MSTRTDRHSVYGSDGELLSETDETVDTTAVDNEMAIRERAAVALDANLTFLAITSPTNAQNAAQVKALTRQVNGLIRLTIGSLDEVD